MSTRFELILCRNRWSVGSHLLRFYMWSRWSHSAILDTHTMKVYDSTFLGKGCRATDFSEWSQKYTTMERRPITVAQEREAPALEWLEAQLGKPYDWTALVGFVVRREWQEDDAWFCSEFSETFISDFSIPRVRIHVSRVTPGIQDILV